jgi:spore coat polysaccharide biosynthesis predicted glycosyltransferase SpsG
MHLLHLHLLEVHDSFFKVRKERLDMYECFVDTCLVKSANLVLRNEHLVNVHLYPHNFNFDVVLGEANSIKNRKSKKEKENQKLEKGKDMDLDDLCKSAGALKIGKVRFGHSKSSKPVSFLKIKAVHDHN